MAFVEILGTDIHYIERGDGPPMLFLHGSGSCAEAWYHQFDTFSDGYRVIAYDSVNHGHSSNSPADGSEPDRADELDAFLGALGIERPVIAGNSMGAMTLLRWAVRHPDRARALIPSGMGVMPTDGRPGPERPSVEPADDDALFLAARGGFTRDFPTTHPDLYDRYIRLRSTATRIEATRRPRPATAKNPGRTELAELVGTIRSPMQIIVGEHDWLAEAAGHLHERVEGSRLAVVPGAPHNVYFETADAYNELVQAFLASLRATV
jgi:pimeloyl-ACP methyl ester carboxylesterase